MLNSNQITNVFNHIGLNLDTTFDGKIENVVVIEIYSYNVLHKFCANCLMIVYVPASKTIYYCNENTFDRSKKG
jgi:hypothetical protein